MTRLCRIGTYPRAGREGVGLAAYELTRRLPYDTLYLTPRHENPAVQPPHGTSLVEIPLHEQILPRHSAGRLRRWAAYVRKGVSLSAFSLRAIPHMVRFRPDVVHIHSIQPFLLAVVARLMGARAVITFHGSDLYRVADAFWFRPAMRVFHRVFYVSHAMERCLQPAVEEQRLQYTPNGVDLDRFSPNGHRRENVVFTAGVLKWQKGIEVLLDAFAEFLQHHSDWRLRIAGDGPLRDEYQRRTERLGISGSVDWLGRLSHTDVRGEYRRARLFALSSHSEGFPKVVLESMACATPAVVTNVGSCAEAVGDAGEVVAPGDAHGLFCALSRLAENDTIWKQKSLESRARSEMFSWDRGANEVSQAVADILEDER